MHDPDSRAFYYWKSSFHLSAGEQALLRQTKCTKLYIRFFDVDWNEENNSPVPVAPITFQDSPDTALEIIPVVYITNRTMLTIASGNIAGLAEKITRQIAHLAAEKHIPYKELQIDCDWSESSRSNYFALLKNLSTQLHTERRMLSATIRLHQVKYPDRTGIPPVDKGMLMFYNMGKVTPAPGRNSIYNYEDAEKYTASFRSYPLPLDAALPLFSWLIQVREGKVIAVLNKAYIAEIMKDSRFTNAGNQSYIARASFFLHGQYFKSDDCLRVEQMTPATSNAAAIHLERYLKYQQRSIALFDLDSTNMTTFNENECNKIFSNFR